MYVIIFPLLCSRWEAKRFLNGGKHSLKFVAVYVGHTNTSDKLFKCINLEYEVINLKYGYFLLFAY
jgi:hypothetical protein